MNVLWSRGPSISFWMTPSQTQLQHINFKMELKIKRNMWNELMAQHLCTRWLISLWPDSCYMPTFPHTSLCPSITACFFFGGGLFDFLVFRNCHFPQGALLSSHLVFALSLNFITDLHDITSFLVKRRLDYFSHGSVNAVSPSYVKILLHKTVMYPGLQFYHLLQNRVPNNGNN